MHHTNVRLNSKNKERKSILLKYFSYLSIIEMQAIRGELIDKRMRDVVELVFRGL